MKARRSSVDDGPASSYLVERYLSRSAVDGLAESVARVALVCAESGRDGTEVRYLQSTFLPTEDTCFCVFQAFSPDDVRAVNARAHFVVDRITDAVLMFTPTIEPPQL